MTTACLLLHKIFCQAENYLGTWFASRWDEVTGFPIDSNEQYSLGFDGIQLILYMLNGNYYASLARADWSASLSQYTYNNDSILPVEQIDASTFSIPFDCTDGVWPWYPGDALYEGHLLLSINPVGILYGEMNSESETVFSSMPLSSSSTWRGGRYIDYDESISTLVFGYDVGDVSEYPLTALGVEALFSNYVEGVWHSTDTIWDFTLYDLHITQARYENYRGNGYLSFDFYGDWEPNHKYTLGSNQFSGFDREGVVLYIDGEEYLPYYG